MKINLHEPTFGEEEIEAAVTQMRTTNVTMGKKVREFEEQCAAYFGSKYCVMSNSGSSANLLAVAALANPATLNHLKPGDEVIVPALSWATSVWPIIQMGLIPVFVDCDLDTYNFNIHKLVAAITPKTKAIMLVHVYGNPYNMLAIKRLAELDNLLVIEDCCEAMGANFEGKKVGTFGNIGTMSLYYSHHITTFEGGLCFTDNFHLAELMRILRAHGWSREADDKQKYINQYPDIDPRFIFVNVGYNLRPTEVQAAIGQVQLPKLDKIIHQRRSAWSEYRNKLDRYREYFGFQKETGYASWFGFGIIVREDAPFKRKELTDFLNEKGIETRPIIAGNMARHPALKMYEHRISGTLENCDLIMQNGFAIGVQKFHQDIVDAVDEFMEKYK
jgi:CDP-6-deoxy-D-xylo-4-hexulose-3-dehydrase